MAEQREQEQKSNPQIEFQETGSVRDRAVRDEEARQRREAVAQQIATNKHRMAMERALDETLAESFPASDPPSSIPDPVDENAA